jgi:hypothetical protein
MRDKAATESCCSRMPVLLSWKSFAGLITGWRTAKLKAPPHFVLTEMIVPAHYYYCQEVRGTRRELTFEAQPQAGRALSTFTAKIFVAVLEDHSLYEPYHAKSHRLRSVFRRSTSHRPDTCSQLAPLCRSSYAIARHLRPWLTRNVGDRLVANSQWPWHWCRYRVFIAMICWLAPTFPHTVPRQIRIVKASQLLRTARTPR